MTPPVSRGSARTTLLWRIWHVLDPVDYLSEFTAALASMLTVVLAASTYSDEVDHPARMLLVVALGCSLGGGLSAGLLMTLENLFQDAARRDLDLRVRVAERAAVDEVCRRVDDATFGRLTPEEAAQIVAAVGTRAGDDPLPPADLRRSNLRVTAACVLYNTCALLAASVPFAFVHDWQIALRVSNAVILALLFLVGFRWGPRIRVSPWRAGLGLLTVGLLLVGISLAVPEL